MSGKATAGSMLSEKVTLGARPVVDFNPVADRLRVIGADGTSLRINVETGATTVDKPLNFDAADASTDKKPAVAAGAYTNSTQGRQGDRAVPCRRRQRRAGAAEPAQRRRAEDPRHARHPGGGRRRHGYRQRGRRQEHRLGRRRHALYTVDLASGKATQVGMIKGMAGKLVDIAVWK